jgi:hypothetical protein
MKRGIIMVVAAVAVAAVAACSNSTSPNSVNIAGTWSLSSGDLSGNGASCTLLGDVQFTQNGNSLGGNLPDSGVKVFCLISGGNSTSQQAGTNLVSGTINNSAVSFNLANGFVVASGTVTGTGAMSGTSITVVDATNSINVSGTWSATLK